jgi:hypothetical protein
VLQAFNYGHSIYGKTAKIVAQLPTEEIANYFLKVGHLERFSVEAEN